MIVYPTLDVVVHVPMNARFLFHGRPDHGPEIGAAIVHAAKSRFQVQAFVATNRRLDVDPFDDSSISVFT